jgi:hypothetical protein
LLGSKLVAAVVVAVAATSIESSFAVVGGVRLVVIDFVEQQ